MFSRSFVIGASLAGLVVVGSLFAWLLSLGQEWKSVATGGTRVGGLAWLSSGEALIATVDNRVFVVGFPNGKIGPNETLDAEATALAVTSQGVMLGLANGQIQWRDSNDLGLKKQWNSPLGVVKSAMVSPNGNRVALGGEKGLVVWSVPEGAFGEVQRPVARPIEQLAWRDDSTLVFGCGDSRLHWLDLGEGESHETKKGGVAIECLGPFPGRRIVTGNKNGGLALWSVALSQPEKAAEAARASIQCVAADQAGIWAAGGGKDGKVYLWDTRSGDRVIAMRGHRGKIQRILLHPSEPFVVTGGSDGTLKFWKVPG